MTSATRGRLSLSSVAFAVVLSCATFAQAAPLPAGGEPATGAGACTEPGDRLHDGFFLRAETGVVLLRAGVDDALVPGRTAIRGVGQSSAVSVGGTPWPGVVVGGSLWASRIDPTFTEGGVRIAPDDDSVKWTLLRVGPFLSFYPSPHSGFHADAALALALAVESDSKGKPIEPGAAGPSLTLGLGQEWFVSSELSLGLAARVAFTRVSRESEGRREHVTAELAELALSYTYH
jgi:hypothetical protein